MDIICNKLAQWMCVAALLACARPYSASGAGGPILESVPGFGRNLIVKTIPAIKDYQSELYEIYMEPYFYPFQRSYDAPPNGRTQKQIDLTQRSLGGAPGLRAAARFQPAGSGAAEGGPVGGELTFAQLVPNGPVTVEGNITGLTPGAHGLHVHQRGYLHGEAACDDLGPHFIAFYGRHGGPRDHVRHVGDLGNIVADASGVASVRLVDPLVSLAGPRSVVGRSIAVTAAADDYGRANTEDSALTGSAGAPVACAVIGYLN